MSQDAEYNLYYHLASLFTGNSTKTVTKVGLGDGSGWHTTDGLGIVTASTIEYLNTATYPYTLHLLKTFTNSGTEEYQITKIGIYDSNATPNLLHTYNISINEIPNMGYLPPGESININIYLTISEFSSSTIEETDFSLLYNILCAVSFVSDFDPADFTPKKPIEYNGIELPNAHITKYDENLGAKSWNIRCYTTDLNLINQIIRYASPIKTGASISGYQYVISPYRSGVLNIQNVGTRTWAAHDRCFISGPVEIEPFGTGYFFDLEIAQSYFEDQT